MKVGFKKGRLVEDRVLRCAEHGSAAFCWVQDDGTHIDDSLCRCLTESPAGCLVDVHRRDAKDQDDLLQRIKKGGKK